MKFGKQILAQQVPGWSAYYLDYKSLKKIVSSLASGRPGAEAAALALGTRPADILSESRAAAAPTGDIQWASWDRPQPSERELQTTRTLSMLPVAGSDEDKGTDFQAHKTAFFFKLERELEKINSFYLQKEAELKLRVETLLSKRRAAATRVLPADGDDIPSDHVEWKAVEEGFRLLERDLGKLQQFVDLNATGFRKILKKWDKRSKSTTKELYLARQVEVQPVFDRQLIAELSDVVASCLLDLTDLSVGLSVEGPAVNDLILTHQIAIERSARMGPFHDLETRLLQAIENKDEVAIRDVVRHSDSLYVQPGGKTHVTRILWKGIIDAPPHLADLVLACAVVPFDFHFVDDINGRTCLHEAASTGELRLVNLCLDKGVQLHRADVYGRSALHYASMNGHASVCRRLIDVGLTPSSPDMDNYTPLMYAVLKGHTDSARVLLDEGHVDVEPITATNDLIPLSLACQVGHVDVVLLLLQRNAKCIPNTNGEYPIHLAAREGHAEICRLLTQLDGWDLPDKYNEWTPLFHAARYGHESCVKVLLELGSRSGVFDETGKQAVFYAAWYGHLGCVNLLLDAATSAPASGSKLRSPSHISPFAEVDASVENDIDLIPSLSLPPPIMPYRVYGHNYLDKACLVHVAVGHHFSKMSTQRPAVQLVPRITGPSTAQYPLASPLFKLVMTSKPDITSAPYSISIPIRDEKDIFMFQTSSLDALLLEFSIYPNFGTKTIGRAIALPFSLQAVQNGQPTVLPVFDHHLHVIGEVAFEVSVITPFQGVTLEIGGAVETYWKSLAMPFTAPAQKPSVRMAQPARTIGSTHTSPSIHSVSAFGSQPLTLSSLTGDYIHLVVQVTRDLYPVIYNDWKLPTGDYDLGVSDVTLAQVQALSMRSGRDVDFKKHRSSPAEWHKILSSSLLSLRHLMRVLPPSLSIYLDLAFPSPGIRDRYSLGHHLDHNQFVDSVLRAVYHSSPTQPRRGIVFGSFSPDICAALNWKQPNYPVFLSSECGVKSRNPPSPTSLSPTDVDDRRLSSISAAVDWAKMNNLLGIFLDANILNKVPTLIQGVKDAGLLIGAYGVREQTVALSKASSQDAMVVDAFLQDGVVSYLDYASRNLC